MQRSRMIPATLLLLTLLASPPDALAQQEPVVARSGTLTLTASPQDATITRDGAPVQNGAQLTLPPGTHTFEVRREGYKTRIETVIMGEGSPSVILSVNLSRADPDTLRVGRTGGVIQDMGEARRPVGWASLVGGSALLATGIFLAARSGVPEECSQLMPQSCKDARDFAGWAVFTASAGGLLTASGLGLLIWDSLAGEEAANKESATRRSLKLTPTARGARVIFSF